MATSGEENGMGPGKEDFHLGCITSILYEQSVFIYIYIFKSQLSHFVHLSVL